MPFTTHDTTQTPNSARRRHYQRQQQQNNVWPLTANRGCALNQAPCNHWMGWGPKCVPVSNLCDGVYHCFDHSDEEHCSGTGQPRPRRLPNDPRAGRYPAFGL